MRVADLRSDLRRVLWHLLGATRGGPLRLRIVALLRAQPSNTNQVAVRLGIDYKTAQHHLRVLAENRLVVQEGEGYGAAFRVSKDLEAAWADFDEIAARLEGPHD